MLKVFWWGRRLEKKSTCTRKVMYGITQLKPSKWRSSCNVLRRQRAGSRGIPSLILNLGARCVWIVKDSPWPDCTRGLVGPGWVWIGNQNRKSFALTGVQIPNCPARIESLHRPRYPGPLWEQRLERTSSVSCPVVDFGHSSLEPPPKRKHTELLEMMGYWQIFIIL
jgi:hypothetical protein